MEAHAWKKNKGPATLVFALLVSQGQTAKKKWTGAQATHVQMMVIAFTLVRFVCVVVGLASLVRNVRLTSMTVPGAHVPTGELVMT